MKPSNGSSAIGVKMLWTLLGLGAIGIVGWLLAEIITRRKDAMVAKRMEGRNKLENDPYAQRHGPHF